MHTIGQRWTEWYGCEWCMLFLHNMPVKTAAHFNEPTHADAYSIITWETWKRKLNIKKNKMLTAAVSHQTAETDMRQTVARRSYHITWLCKIKCSGKSIEFCSLSLSGLSLKLTFQLLEKKNLLSERFFIAGASALCRWANFNSLLSFSFDPIGISMWSLT